MSKAKWKLWFWAIGTAWIDWLNKWGNVDGTFLLDWYNEIGDRAELWMETLPNGAKPPHIEDHDTCYSCGRRRRGLETFLSYIHDSLEIDLCPGCWRKVNGFIRGMRRKHKHKWGAEYPVPNIELGSRALVRSCVSGNCHAWKHRHDVPKLASQRASK